MKIIPGVSELVMSRLALEENNYCPFGLKHEGYNSIMGNLSYQYKYNGKELQTESGMYDYGARMYMPDLGRWGVVDPLAEVNRAWSPFRYAFNNPIRFIDPDGRNEDIYEMDERGHLTNRQSSETDIIYTSKNFEGEGKDRKLKENHNKGFEIGEQGYIAKNNHQYLSTGDKYMDFKGDEAKGMAYFNQVGDWMKANEVNVEFGIQTADINGKDNTVVYNSGEDSLANAVYGGDNVKLSGHLHPGLMNSENGGGIDFSGPLNPSGFLMSKFPTKENDYTFSIIGKTQRGDRLSAERSPNAIHFIYAPSYNTTIIYNKDQIIKAYEGKYKKN